MPLLVQVRVVGPRDLQVSELGHSSLRLTWSHATSNVRGYRLLITPLGSKGHLPQRQVRAHTWPRTPLRKSNKIVPIAVTNGNRLSKCGFETLKPDGKWQRESRTSDNHLELRTAPETDVFPPLGGAAHRQILRNETLMCFSCSRCFVLECNPPPCFHDDCLSFYGLSVVVQLNFHKTLD